MMWSFKEDIAIYNSSIYFIIIFKIKLVEFNHEDKKDFDTDLTIIHTHGDFSAQFTSRIIGQLHEDMREYGLDNFQIHRRCEVCNELFLKTSKNKMICSGKCRTRKNRDKK